ncbi:MAG: hypothetical protein AAF710_00140 [Planctomycetota bacterium]
MTLSGVVNQWLARQEDRRNAGEIAAGTFADYLGAGKLLVDVMGRQTPLSELGPTASAKLQRRIDRLYTNVPTTAVKTVTICRMPFRWAYEME